jgi:D-alanyl-D-alanine carboxypeptidase
MPTLGTVDQLVPIAAPPPNLREESCGKNRKRPAAEDEEVEVSANADGSSPLSFLLSNLQSNVKVSDVLANGNPMLPPVDVFVGAVKPSSLAAAEAQESQLAGGGKRAKKPAKAKTKVAAKPKPDKPEPSAKPAAGTRTAAKPATPDKPEPAAKPKPITTGAAAAGVAPKPAAKPTTAKPAAAKPATQSAAKPQASNQR